LLGEILERSFNTGGMLPGKQATGKPVDDVTVDSNPSKSVDELLATPKLASTAPPTIALAAQTNAPGKRAPSPIDAGLRTEVAAGGADLIIAALKEENVANHLRSAGHQPDWRTPDDANDGTAK